MKRMKTINVDSPLQKCPVAPYYTHSGLALSTQSMKPAEIYS